MAVPGIERGRRKMMRARRHNAERPADWERLEQLFDELMALSPEARERRLEELRGSEREIASELASLIACAPLADGYFRQLPRVAAAVAADVVSSHSESLPGRSRPVFTDDHPGSVIAQYRIGEQIGRGGMGVVYRGSDTRLGRPVALKFLPPHLWVDRGARERLLVEARAAASLDHPNICAVHEVGETPEGALFLAMALYDGETLRDRLARGPMAVTAAVDIAIQVARALGAAHAQGIVHRDVKPANLMLTSSGVVKLLDFGLARLPDVTMTPTGLTPGTIAYMSPEHVRGEPVDTRSDLWALGVVLFEMLTGRRPFGGDSEAAVLHAIIAGNPPRPSRLRADVPSALDEIVARLLRRDRAQRYRDAVALLVDLDGARSPARGRPRPALWRVARWAGVASRGRRQVAVRAGAGTVAAGLAVVAWLAQGKTPTVNPEAFDHYVQGTQARYPRTSEHWQDMGVAADHFERAIAVDSAYAPAYAGLASVYAFSGDEARARQYVDRAIALDPNLAEARMVLGIIRQSFDGDWRGSEGAFRHAIRLSPGYAEAHHELSMLLMRRNRFDEALDAAQRALYLAPMSARFQSGLAEVYYFHGRYREAVRAANEAHALDSNWVVPGGLRAAAYGHLGRYDEAIVGLTRLADQVGGDVCFGELGYFYARAQQRDRALEFLRTCEAGLKKNGQDDPGRAYTLAQIHAGLGNREQALTLLERAAKGGPRFLINVRVDPTLHSLRSEPRFRTVLKKVGLDR